MALSVLIIIARRRSSASAARRIGGISIGGAAARSALAARQPSSSAHRGGNVLSGGVLAAAALGGWRSAQLNGIGSVSAAASASRRRCGIAHRRSCCSGLKLAAASAHHQRRHHQRVNIARGSAAASRSSSAARVAAAAQPLRSKLKLGIGARRRRSALGASALGARHRGGARGVIIASAHRLVGARGVSSSWRSRRHRRIGSSSSSLGISARLAHQLTRQCFIAASASASRRLGMASALGSSARIISVKQLARSAPRSKMALSIAAAQLGIKCGGIAARHQARRLISYHRRHQYRHLGASRRNRRRGVASASAL